MNHHHLDSSKCVLNSFLKTVSLSRLLTKLDGPSMCTVQSDVHFVKIVAAKKGKIIPPNRNIAAYYVDNDSYTKTICRADCKLSTNVNRASEEATINFN